MVFDGGVTRPRYEHDRRYFDNGFLYSEDVSNANWTTSSARAYADGKTVAFEAAAAQLYQSLPQLYNDTYEVKAQVRLVSGDGSFAFNVFNGTTNTQGGTHTATSGWQWFTSSIASGAETTSGRAGLWKLSGAGVLQFRRLQISRGSSNGKYRRTTSQRRYQRIGVITEAAATNSLLRSAEYDNAAWNKVGITPTANTHAAPDGTTTVDTLSCSSAGQLIYQDLSLGGTTARALSLIFRSGGTATSVDLTITWQTGGASQFVLCRFNPSTGAFVLSSSSGATLRNAGVRDLGGGFYRAYVMGVGTDATNTVLRTSANWNTTGTLLAWGSQNEATYVTTYIPTTTAAVTRTVDTAVVETATWVPYVLNASEGTLYHELQTDDIPGDSTRTVAIVGLRNSAGTYADDLISRLNYIAGTGYQINAATWIASGNTWLSPSTTVAANTVIRAAIRYRASDMQHALNGVSIGTSASAVPPNINRMELMREPTCTSYLRRVALWPTGKSSSELLSLTSSGPSAIDFDSGWDDALQMSMSGDVPTLWGHDYDVIKTFSERAVEWVRLELYDPGKTAAADAFEIGRAFIGKLTLQPGRNAAYGLGDSWQEPSTFVTTEDGRRVFKELDRVREVNFELPQLTLAEGQTLHEMVGSSGIVDEVLYLPDPDDEAACQKFGFVGLMERLDPLVAPLVLRRSMAFHMSKKR